MKLRENDVGQELKFGSYNLHDSSIINSWTFVVCFCSPLRCRLRSKTLKLKTYGKPSSLFLNSFFFLHSIEVCIVNSEFMRVDIYLSLTFFFSQFVEFETCAIVKKLSLQLVFEPSTW
jgi:hypothetical protein